VEVNIANPKSIQSRLSINKCSRYLDAGMALQIQNHASFGEASTAAAVANGNRNGNGNGNRKRKRNGIGNRNRNGNGLRALKRYNLSLNHSAVSAPSLVPHTDVTLYAHRLRKEDSEQIAAADRLQLHSFTSTNTF